MALQGTRDEAACLGRFGEGAEHLGRSLATNRGQAHRLLDDHEASGQETQAGHPRRVRLELLLHAGRDIGVLGEEVVDDGGRGRCAQDLRRLGLARQVQVS